MAKRKKPKTTKATERPTQPRDDKSIRGWETLPAEVRLLIIEALSNECRGHLALYASNIREMASSLDGKFDKLGKIAATHRNLIKHIWLDVELHEYTCRSCQEKESSGVSEINGRSMRKAITYLFTTMKDWAPAGDLTLEITAHSPSDSKHWFKELGFGNEDPDSQPGWHDPKHGWADGQQVTPPNGLALSRVYSKLEFRLPWDLPDVHAVTKLVIRRQVRRSLTPIALEELKCVFSRGLPRTLQTLSLFEVFDEEHIAPLQKEAKAYNSISIERKADPRVCEALVSRNLRRTLSLTHLSVAFLIDARDFFQEIEPKTWNCLQSLVLTSRILTQKAHKTKVSSLLCDVGKAASSMPQLHTLALWNAKKGEACSFVYNKQDRSVTWRGTWDLKDKPGIVEAWERTVSSGIQFETVSLKGNLVDSLGDAIPLLELPPGVIDPVSLRHMQNER
ncbi:hypothetical protein FDECE_5950 [Fusarium decemcellulare]|nr:hypothetical protein FDECE_5950 [Fusarium decemcellulare]